MKPYFYTAVLIITFLLPLSSHANTFCVSDATGLQTALTTASGNSEDDTVQIEQGTYVGSFIYASTEAFNLTVEGGYTSGCGSKVVDPTNTVLDANSTGSVLVFSTPDTIANLEVDGLTLQNGVAGNDRGGGIYAKTLGNITLTNNSVTGNSAIDGGGVFSHSSDGTITFTNTTITGNSASDRGGGVFTENPYATTSITFTNSIITENSANQHGGGICAENPNGILTFTNNMLAGNSASLGGGFYAHTNRLINLTFSNNTFTGNSASYGGGVFTENPDTNATITFINNTIMENEGGGVYFPNSNSPITLTNNILIGNLGNAGGVYVHSNAPITLINNTITANLGTTGGVYAYSIASTITLTNNTFTENSANYGGGMHIILVQNSAVADIINNIIWNNTATNAGNDLYLNNDGDGDYFPNTVNLFNNDFDQSADGTYIEIPFTIDPSNLDNEDPLFVDAPSGDYHLTALSPCIDVGSLAEAPPDDMDGHPRPQGDGVDIGADEYIPLDVDEDGVPNEVDNCPFDANPAQTDTDHDCIGDECDDFPNDYDPTVPDFDGDGIGDACDVCPYDLNNDIEADGICGNEDNCPDIPNGPDLGSCINILTGVVGSTCINDGECGTGETCSNDQEDRDNNGSGDACDIGTFCRGLADFDQDVDANDVTVFLSHFGRSQFNNPCPLDGPAPVAKTGQTTCYDALGGVISCAGTGQDGDSERGVALVTPRFTDNGDGTVTDNQTGLIWMKNADCFGERTWDQALSDCNGLADDSCGLTDASSAGDWRLPNVREIESLRDYGQWGPALTIGHPFIGIPLFMTRYWSSTTYLPSDEYAIWVGMKSSAMDGDLKASVVHYVWCVRGGH